MKIPDKFPEGCRFWASFSGDEYVEFPDDRIFKLDDSGESIQEVRALPRSGAAPMSEASFLNCAEGCREFNLSKRPATAEPEEVTPQKFYEPILSSRFALAFQFANEIHATQRRKGGGVPYISHLLSVCALVLEYGGDEDQAIGALLHDSAEDCGGRPMLETVRTMFGDRVAAIVEGCTDTFETPKPEWQPRKEAYLKHLETATDDIRLVAAADKFHNLSCTARDMREGGLEIFAKFNVGLNSQRWYYRECLNALRKRGKDFPIYNTLENQLDVFESIAHDLERRRDCPNVGNFDADTEIRHGVRDAAIKHVCERAKHALMKMPSYLAGDDGNLKNTWEDLCVQLQFEESTSWDDYQFTISQVIDGALQGCPPHEKLAIWLETPFGLEWRYSDEEESGIEPYVDDVELVKFIQRDHLYPMAHNWSNPRIRGYVDRFFEYEGIESATEPVVQSSDEYP
jgi:hypothetical protein